MRGVDSNFVGVESVALPKWSLLVVVKFLQCAKPCFVGEKFCSETLGCRFRCFGRPWRFLLGTIRCRVIEFVLMTSRPPMICYTLCYVLCTVYSRVCTIYFRLCSAYIVSIYIYILQQDHSKEAIQFFTHRFGPCGSPTVVYYSIL